MYHAAGLITTGPLLGCIGRVQVCQGARRCFLFINKAWGYGDSKPDHYFLAPNYRLSELQGAVAAALAATMADGSYLRIINTWALRSGRVDPPEGAGEKAAEEPKVEEPKAEEPKAEEPKAEESATATAFERLAGTLVEAIESGNGEAAARWMARHLDAIRDELKNIIR